MEKLQEVTDLLNSQIQAVKNKQPCVLNGFFKNFIDVDNLVTQLENKYEDALDFYEEHYGSDTTIDDEIINYKPSTGFQPY